MEIVFLIIWGIFPYERMLSEEMSSKISAFN